MESVEVEEDESSPAEQEVEQEELISQQEMVEEEVTSESENFDLQTEEVEMRGVVVLTQEDAAEETSDKSVYLEPVTQDGQTYVLTLSNGQETLQSARFNAAAKSDSSMDESDYNQAWFTSREDKSVLHRKGQLWKQGMWSKEETEILQNNVIRYCKERGINHPTEIIFEMTKDERKDFYRTIAKGLNRPLFSVYRRVIRMYDNKNHVGKYTPEEIERLKELRTKHGNDWQAIGSALGRSASSIKDRCRLMKDNCNTGKWLPNEEKRLADAVYQQSRTVPGEPVTSGISWATVAESVGTRSEKQCRTKWLNYLNWKQIGGTEWTREDDINLICKVYGLNVNDENGIEWAELSQGWPSVRSPQWLRGKWWNLKRHVPDAHLLSFRGICEYLYNNHAQIVHVKVNGDENASNSILETVTSATPLTIPPVSVVPAPSIVTTVPLQVKPDEPVNSTTGQPSTQTQEEIHTINPAPLATTFQTYEVLPPTVHLNPSATATPFLIAAPSQTIPFNACTPTTAGQIIIQTFPAESLQANDVTVHMNMPSQIIINTAGALGHAGLPTPIQLARPLTTHLLTTTPGTLITGTGELLTPASLTEVQEISMKERLEQEGKCQTQKTTEISTESQHLILSGADEKK